MSLIVNIFSLNYERLKCVKRVAQRLVKSIAKVGQKSARDFAETPITTRLLSAFSDVVWSSPKVYQKCTGKR